MTHTEPYRQLPEPPAFPMAGDTWTGLGETWIYSRPNAWTRINPNSPQNNTISSRDFADRIHNLREIGRAMSEIDNGADFWALRLTGTDVLARLVNLGYYLSGHDGEYLKQIPELFQVLGTYSGLTQGIKYTITASVKRYYGGGFNIELNPDNFTGPNWGVTLLATKTESGLTYKVLGNM